MAGLYKTMTKINKLTAYPNRLRLPLETKSIASQPPSRGATSFRQIPPHRRRGPYAGTTTTEPVQMIDKFDATRLN